MQYSSERWDDKHLAELERDGRYTSSERGEVILVVVCDFLDDSVFSESSDERRYLLGCLGRQAL